ncbi:MAG: sugar ABC transporter permease [Geminicoccaceae bacterium]
MATVTLPAAAVAARPPRRIRYPAAYIAMLPAAAIIIVAYLGCMLWTARLSFTSSKLLPKLDFVGLAQYQRLFENERFILSIQNIVVFGVLYLIGALIIGFLMAVFIDQRVRGEAVFRTIYLYPYSMSFIVTGLAWQWFLNPTLGLQKLVRDVGFTGFTFDWIVNQDMVIYTLVIAGLWHASGLVMAILLAGLRGIDADLWNAARVDGIPTWRVYLSVVIPLLGPMVVTVVVLLSVQVARLYDLVVAMTRGGPGIASEVPAKFVMDHLFERNNIGLATAAATVMLVTVVCLLAPWLYVRYMRPQLRRV